MQNAHHSMRSHSHTHHWESTTIFHITFHVWKAQRQRFPFFRNAFIGFVCDCRLVVCLPFKSHTIDVKWPGPSATPTIFISSVFFMPLKSPFKASHEMKNECITHTHTFGVCTPVARESSQFDRKARMIINATGKVDTGFNENRESAREMNRNKNAGQLSLSMRTARVSMVWHHRQSTPARAINYHTEHSIHNYAVFSTWTTISSLPICRVCTVCLVRSAHTRSLAQHRCIKTLKHTQRLCIVIETAYNWTVQCHVFARAFDAVSVHRVHRDGFVYMENCVQRRLFVLQFRLLRCSHRVVCATHHTPLPCRRLHTEVASKKI